MIVSMAVWEMFHDLNAQVSPATLILGRGLQRAFFSGTTHQTQQRKRGDVKGASPLHDAVRGRPTWLIDIRSHGLPHHAISLELGTAELECVALVAATDASRAIAV